MIHHQPTIRAIRDATCAHYDIRVGDLLSARRTRTITRPRQVVMWLAKQLTPRSLPEIGRHLGGRDHTTVLHGIRVIEARIATDPRLREDVETISAALGAVTEGGHLAPDLRVEVDPLAVAMHIATASGAAVSVSVVDIEAMARCLVGYALVLGAITLTGEDEPDPEMAPIEVPTVPAALAEALQVARLAWRVFEGARFGRGETAALYQLSKALKALFETHSNS